jgi:hypothetical protein
MTDPFEIWLEQVQNALRSINMEMKDWQKVWPFDFRREHGQGADPDAAAMKANRFWWRQQNKSMRHECNKVVGCWLPESHQGECQPEYEWGDYVKVEFEGENGMPGEWMWCVVQSRDDEKGVVYCTLDNEPLNEYSGKAKLGSKLSVGYANVREHRKASEFTKQ